MISVVIPVHNRPKAALRAARSALTQDLEGAAEVEVVLVDDASDPPLDLGPLERTRIVRLDRNGGPAVARNRGVAAARGELIAFLDSDDVWLAGKLARQLELYRKLARGEADWRLAVICGFYYPERASGRLEARMPMPGRDAMEFASGCWSAPGTVLLFHRNAFTHVGPLDERLRRLEDYDWLLRLALLGGRLEVAGIAGAVIAPSGLARSDIVGRNIARLEAKYGAGGEIALPPAVARRFAAYMALERAAASLADGHRVRGAASLAHSALLKPRLRGALLPFWTRSDAVPAEVAAIYRELAGTSTAS